jgi:methionyl-tRNA formyltransferase
LGERATDFPVSAYRRAKPMNTTNDLKPKILMLGSDSAFSGIVLRCLLEAGTEVCGFVIHEAPPRSRAFESLGDEIPVVVAGTGPAIASEGGVAVIHVGSMHDGKVLERVRCLEPDILLVACFPMILGGPWLNVAKQMCLNVHPSVLPSYRGPTPLFWQFREGEHETGVTLHVIEEGIDAGDVVAQSVMPLSVGARFSEVNAKLAETGAALMVDMLQKSDAGIAVPRTAQDELLASYQPFPKEKDFRFDTHFTAERAFRFMRGTEEWGVHFEVDVGGAVLALERALEYHDDARTAAPFEIDGDRVRIRFSEGVLEAVGRYVAKN